MSNLLEDISLEDFELYLYDLIKLKKTDIYSVAFKEAKEFYHNKEFNIETSLHFFRYLRTKKNKNTGEYITSYTINNYLKSMRHIANYLIFKGKLKENFLTNDKWKQDRTVRPRIDILDEEEMFQMLDIAYKDCYRKALAFETLLSTGMRPNELFTAKWDQLQNNELFLPKTKTGKSRSVVILNDLYQKYLHLEKVPNNYIFGTFRGKINLRRFNEVIRKWLKIAKINKKIRNKELRHSYATMLAAYGVSHFVIKESLGHSTIQTTEGYIHTNKKMLEDAAKKVPLRKYSFSENEKIDETRKFCDYMRRHDCLIYMEDNLGEIVIKVIK